MADGTYFWLIDEFRTGGLLKEMVQMERGSTQPLCQQLSQRGHCPVASLMENLC